METSTDRADVVVLPPLLMVIALIIVVVLHYLWPFPIGMRVPFAVLGGALGALGVGTVAWGRVTLVNGGTNVNPLKPTTAIVNGGPFRFTRNPLYVGVMSLFVGLSFLVGTWWGLIVLVPVFLILHFGIVLREERYLERKFGQQYLAYQRAVRRYL